MEKHVSDVQMAKLEIKRPLRQYKTNSCDYTSTNTKAAK